MNSLQRFGCLWAGAALLATIQGFAWARAGELTAAAPAKKIVFFGGVKTHGPGAHEHLQGAQLLKQWFDTTPGLPPTRTQIFLDAWPKDSGELDAAATIVLMWEGWDLHLISSRNKDKVEKLDRLMRRGVGLVCFHAATAVDNDVEPQFLDWVGGNKKRDYSLHPMARNVEIALAAPDHPVCRGVQPMRFAEEEFYCKIFFRPGDRRVHQGDDRGGQQGGVDRPGLADGQRADGHAARHLDDRHQAVHALQRVALDGHAEHRQRRHGRGHARQEIGRASCRERV